MRQDSWIQVAAWKEELCSQTRQPHQEAPRKKPRAATKHFTSHLHCSYWQHINPKTLPVRFLTLTLAWAWRNDSAGFGAKYKNHWPIYAQTGVGMKAWCNSILNIAHRGGFRHAKSRLTDIWGKKNLAKLLVSQVPFIVLQPWAKF